ncbi:TadE/TadG family type IV pilus assembly protein [Lentzea aerocolonigenes]|uniref:TadE/TadG family type IV pilus assembly protein n=1 Tax=Lentzea aerocolonigenes TaxID=68170 RepID=UPI0012DF714A|nr:TadE/TadG family type IV pilus assembly protein [Lentzea aerocolonigenes]
MTTPTRHHRKRHERRLAAARHCGWLLRFLKEDRGAASADLVLFTPLLLLALLTFVQFALWSHATHIAQAAASQGLAATRAHNGTTAAGTASARQLLDQLAQGPLTGASASAERTTESASVRITGTASAVVPFLRLPVHAEAAGPVERFVPNVYGFRNSEAVVGGNQSGGGR